MSMATTGHLARILIDNQEALLEGWLGGMLSRMVRRDKAAEGEIRQQAGRFLTLVARAVERGQAYDFDAPAWAEVRQLLAEMSAARVRQGFSPTETAGFIFSLKEPLFALLRSSLAADPAVLAAEVSDTGMLFDRMGLFTIEEYQKGRESVIMRQQQELLELSTPVVQLWKDVLALPLIGTLDSARTQVVMENLLQKIIETGASIAIIDITGVPTVDTLVAQHLLKTVAAARLMGADCIISGIRPQIAQTIVHLGVNLEDVITKATLADAFLVALKRVGATVVRAEAAH
ncbi:STAS domain-containing protein [Pseudoduganella albidiflava]|uniref:Polyvinylalcohol dehydrogenase n=1 Tax=Pseudoduganella albidiflava TaxID=321983 RepID=A0A411X3H3_9BURK|nr:STAS domain-containing protein [Pseudoduganella albidiflava]QBI03412.1 STAS domain-containing protein [Pseudoduganella albidiflava]GGY49832.1 polyvinylalcohol dehydrogenase [Pseudoduganella albidiflava]